MSSSTVCQHLFRPTPQNKSPVSPCAAYKANKMRQFLGITVKKGGPVSVLGLACERTLRNVYGVGGATVGPTAFRYACIFMCRHIPGISLHACNVKQSFSLNSSSVRLHIYLTENIIKCDVKQPISFTHSNNSKFPQWTTPVLSITSLTMVCFPNELLLCRVLRP